MFSKVKWVSRRMIWATKFIFFMVGFFTFLDWLKKILPYNLNLFPSSVVSLLTTVSLSSLVCRPFVAVIVIFHIAFLHILSMPPRKRTHKTRQRGLELLKTKTRLLTYDVKPHTSSATHSEEEFSPLLINSNPSDAATKESHKTKLVETIPAAVVVKHVLAELKKEDKNHIRSEAGIPSLKPAGTPPLPLPRPSSYQKKPIVKHTAEIPTHSPLASSLPTETARLRSSSYQKKPTLDCPNKPPSPSSPSVRGRLSGSHEKKPIIRSSVEFPSYPPLPSSDHRSPIKKETTVKPSLLEFPSHPPPVSSPPAYGHRSPNEKKPVCGARTRARWSETTATVGLLRHVPLDLGSWKVVQDDRSYGSAHSYQSDHDCFSQEEQQLFFMDEEMELLDKGRDKRPEPSTSRWQEEDEEMEEEKVVMVDVVHPESLEAKWRTITAEARTLKKSETWDVPPEPSSEAARRAMKKWETFKDPLPLPMVPAALRKEQQNERDELRNRADAFIMKIKYDMLLQRQQSAEERYMEMINRGTM